MLTPRELATVLAALLYWREEMTPHARAVQQPYFEAVELGHTEPLSAAEIEQLADRLRRMARPADSSDP